MVEPGGVAGRLDVHPVVDHVHQHLGMPLGLHVAPHQAEREPGLAVLGDEAGDDRVERPLVRLQPVGVRRVEGEQAAPVLEREAEVARDVARAEPVEVALDQADGVAVLVDHRHVDRVRRLRVAGRGPVVGMGGVDQLAPARGVRLRDQLGDGDPGEIGVGVVFGPVLVGELLGLDHQVERLGRLRPHRLEVVRLQEVEDLQDRDPLAVGRQFPDVVAPIIRRDGLDPGAGVVLEVLAVKQAADRLRVVDDRVGHLALVEGVAAVADDRPERPGQPGVAEDLADLRGLAAGRKHAAEVGTFASPARRPLPGGGDDLADGEAVLGVGDRRGEQVGPGPRPEPGPELVPAVDAAGDRPAQRAGLGDLREPLER